MAKTEKISLRLAPEVLEALAAQGADRGFGVTEHIQRLLERRAAKSGLMQEAAARRVRRHWKMVEAMQTLARKLDSAGKFDAHFTLTVFREAMSDDGLRAQYAEAIEGDPYGVGVPGKSPLNMHLGQAIRTAVGAEPLKGPGGAPLRGQVRGEPIQTYQLLTKGI